MHATILLQRRPADAGDAWLRRSLVALAMRFRDARVRMLVADADAAAAAAGGGVRAAPPGADFDVMVVVERARATWLSPTRPEMQPPAEALAWLSGARAHLASVRRLRGAPAPAGAGERSPGVVFVATAVRAPDLDAREFDAHWRERHGPLALAHHAGLSGYEQLTVTRSLGADAPSPDGFALLHFPAAKDFRERFYDSDAGRDAILADARQFLDVPRCQAILASEYWARC